MRRDVHTSDAGANGQAAAGRAGADEAREARGKEPVRRIARLRDSRRTSFLGVPEVVALVAAAALLALAFAAYFLLLAPEYSNLASLDRERQQLQAQIRSAGENREQKRGVDETVERIKQSLTRFETESLVSRETSERALYEELNEKIRRSGLQRAQFSFSYQDDSQKAGPTQAEQQRAAGNLSGNARRRQTVFPATDISLTVEGTYANLRRFIREVESSPRFVVINGVQLEGLNDTSSGGSASGGVVSEGATPAGPAGRGAVAAGPSATAGSAPRGALVSLRLDMSAYFRRSATASVEQGGATAARQGTSQ